MGTEGQCVCVCERERERERDKTVRPAVAPALVALALALAAMMLGVHAASGPLAGPSQRTRQPIVTGTSVLGITYK